jgi:hypothetical protein
MSDYNSSLPIRTENAGDAIVKVADATVPSQQLAVNADGSVNITDNGSSITVDASNLDIRDLAFATDKVDASGSTVDVGNTVTVQSTNLDIRDLVFATDKVDVSGSSITATDLDIRDLDAAQDNVAISDGTDTLAINADGSINVSFAPGNEVKITDGTDDLEINADGSLNAVVTATNLDIRDLTFATDKVDASGSQNVEVVQAAHDDLNVNANIQVGNADVANGNPVPVSDAGGSLTVDATDFDIRDLAFATDKVDISGSSNVTVVATNLDIRDLTHVSDSVKVGDGTDFLAVNTDGSINVVMQEDSGTEIVNYNTVAAVAAGATSNHDWTSAAVSKLYQVWASASGKLRIEVQIETGAATGVFNTIAVGFNSTANPNINLDLSKFAAVPNGARVRVIRRNNDNQSQDVYSTIIAIQG